MVCPVGANAYDFQVVQCAWPSVRRATGINFRHAYFVARIGGTYIGISGQYPAGLSGPGNREELAAVDAGESSDGRGKPCIGKNADLGIVDAKIIDLDFFVSAETGAGVAGTKITRYCTLNGGILVLGNGFFKHFVGFRQQVLGESCVQLAKNAEQKQYEHLFHKVVFFLVKK